MLPPLQEEVRRPGAHAQSVICTQDHVTAEVSSHQSLRFSRSCENKCTVSNAPPLPQRKGKGSTEDMGNWGSWEVTAKILVTFSQPLRGGVGGAVLSDPHSHWAFYWLPLAWPAL